MIKCIVLLFCSLCLSKAVDRAQFYQYDSSDSIGLTTATRNLDAPINYLDGFYPSLAMRYQIFRRVLNFYDPFTLRQYCLVVLKPPGATQSSGATYLGLKTDAGLLQRAENEIKGAFPDAFPSPPTLLFIYTLIDLRRASSPQNDDTTFQLVVATNGRSSYGIIHFESVESAIPNQASINMGALGACENGGRTIYSLPYESDVSQAPSLSLNSPVNGTYIFRLASPPPSCNSCCH